MHFFPQITSQRQPQVRSTSTSQVRKPIQCWCAKLGQRAIAFFTQNLEPKITQRNHTDGTFTWRIYDPYSGQSTVCHSVAEVREWLEARYSYRRLY